MATDPAERAGVRAIKASEFKAKCLQLMDEVAETGEDIIITKHSRPVSRLTPYRDRNGLAFGRNSDIIEIHGDIVSPMPTEWFDTPDGSGDDLF